MKLIFSFKTTTIVFLAFVLAACDALQPPGIITNVVLAPGVKAGNEPTSTSLNYPPVQEEIHAIVTLTNAPKDSAVKVVWTAIDVGAAAPPDTKVGESETKSEGTRNLDFALKRPGNSFASGLYKAEIFLNGKLDRTLQFQVEGTPLKAGAKTGCPAATTQAQKPSGLIAKVTLAERTKEDNEPVNPTAEFLANETISAIVEIANTPANTKIKTVFSALDAGNSSICNAKLGEAEQVVEGSKRILFTQKPASPWALGKYRVEIYVNDALAHTTNYVVVTQKQVR